MGHYVYKYVYNGEIVYIGKNDTDLKTRIKQHEREEKFQPYLKSDIYYIEVANKIMSDVVESELIRRYKPKLNVAKMSDWSGLEFTEPEWEKFISKNKNQTIKEERYVCEKFIVPDGDIHELRYIYENKDKAIIDGKNVYLYMEKENLTKGYIIRIYIKDNETGKRTEMGRTIMSSLFKLVMHKSCSDIYCYKTSINKFKNFVRDFESIPILG